jgi:hypothetical protein
MKLSFESFPYFSDEFKVSLLSHALLPLYSVMGCYFSELSRDLGAPRIIPTLRVAWFEERQFSRQRLVDQNIEVAWNALPIKVYVMAMQSFSEAPEIACARILRKSYVRLESLIMLYFSILLHSAHLTLELLCRLCATSFTVLSSYSLLDSTCFGLTGHLQVYRLLWLSILPRGNIIGGNKIYVINKWTSMSVMYGRSQNMSSTNWSIWFHSYSLYYRYNLHLLYGLSSCSHINCLPLFLSRRWDLFTLITLMPCS